MFFSYTTDPKVENSSKDELDLLIQRITDEVIALKVQIENNDRRNSNKLSPRALETSKEMLRALEGDLARKQQQKQQQTARIELTVVTEKPSQLIEKEFTHESMMSRRM